VTSLDSVQFLYALGNEIKTARLGLSRIRALLDALGNPERAYRVVHVAGTNGKGSTAATLSSIAAACGLRAGLYTSPHLIGVLELRVAHRVVEEVAALDLERRNPANWRGSCHGGAASPEQSGYFRPVEGWSSYRTPVAGLYQTGACTHPGGSVSGLPGRNCATVLLEDLGSSLAAASHAVDASGLTRR